MAETTPLSDVPLPFIVELEWRNHVHSGIQWCPLLLGMFQQQSRVTLCEPRSQEPVDEHQVLLLFSHYMDEVYPPHADLLAERGPNASLPCHITVPWGTPELPVLLNGRWNMAWRSNSQSFTDEERETLARQVIDCGPGRLLQSLHDHYGASMATTQFKVTVRGLEEWFSGQLRRPGHPAHEPADRSAFLARHWDTLGEWLPQTASMVSAAMLTEELSAPSTPAKRPRL